LVHLIGFEDLVIQRHPIAVLQGQVLEAMAEVVRHRAVALQLAGQWRGGHALGDAAKDQDQLSDRPLRAVEGGVGEEVEDSFAVVAAVVDHRGAMTAMDAELIGALTAGADQALGMEPVEQGHVASVGVQQFFDGKVHDDLA